MSNEIYPELPGLSYGVHRKTKWDTDIRKTPTKREYRSSFVTYPVRLLTLSYEFLTGGFTAGHQETLEGFFNRHHGALDSFLLRDPDDGQVTAQPFGVGNGAATQFALVRTRGGFVEPVSAADGAISVFKNGVLQTSGVTVSGSVVTFSTPPAFGDAVTWSGAYLWRVRFEGDDLDFEKMLHRIWKTGKVEMTTFKA